LKLLHVNQAKDRPNITDLGGGLRRSVITGKTKWNKFVWIDGDNCVAFKHPDPVHVCADLSLFAQNWSKQTKASA
jgi:hypothetical protein